MRVHNSPENAAFIDWISNLSYDSTLQGLIGLPSYISQPIDIGDLLNKVYPLPILQAVTRDSSIFQDRVLLTTLNSSVADLNQMVLDAFPGTSRTYLSIDLVDNRE